jgi:hypothetical protein
MLSGLLVRETFSLSAEPRKAAMPGRIRTMIQTFWSSLTGRNPESGILSEMPPVLLHDPAAQGPHDLDDPYLDENVQKRFGGTISKSMQDRD